MKARPRFITILRTTLRGGSCLVHDHHRSHQGKGITDGPVITIQLDAIACMLDLSFNRFLRLFARYRENSKLFHGSETGHGLPTKTTAEGVCGGQVCPV